MVIFKKVTFFKSVLVIRGSNPALYGTIATAHQMRHFYIKITQCGQVTVIISMNSSESSPTDKAFLGKVDCGSAFAWIEPIHFGAKGQTCG